jgi:hypothetical protein
VLPSRRLPSRNDATRLAEPAPRRHRADENVVSFSLWATACPRKTTEGYPGSPLFRAIAPINSKRDASRPRTPAFVPREYDRSLPSAEESWSHRRPDAVGESVVPLPARATPSAAAAGVRCARPSSLVGWFVRMADQWRSIAQRMGPVNRAAQSAALAGHVPRQRTIGLSQAFARENVSAWRSSRTAGSSASCTTVGVGATTRHAAWKRRRTRSGRKCHACLRYGPSCLRSIH